MSDFDYRDQPHIRSRREWTRNARPIILYLQQSEYCLSGNDYVIFDRCERSEYGTVVALPF